MAFDRFQGADELTKWIQKEESDTDFGKIRCPLCEWRPVASSRWCCADCETPENFDAGCFAMWNTFETRGKCPKCNHQWIWTSCLSCAGWSLHEDWYEEANT